MAVEQVPTMWLQCSLDCIKKLKFLDVPHYIGSRSIKICEEKYRFMVMERFGPSIQKLFEAINCHFKKNLNLALIIIDVLE